MADETYPWPEQFEEPFGPERGPDSVYNACMEPAPSMFRYATAYRTGAEVLFKYLAEAGGSERHHNDLVVYPIVFCWRQFLELTLKEMVAMARTLNATTGSADLGQHRLTPLWRELRKHLPDLGAPQVEMDTVEKTIAYLDAFDAGSFAFRYPTDKKGASTQKDIPLLISLRKLDAVMQRIANWLDAGRTEAARRLEWHYEQLAAEE
jgi:hypothetical protein